MVTQELIDKFFRNECNDEERKLVLRHFEDHPEAWDQYLNEEDWENFTTDERLHPAVSKKIFSAVSHHTFRQNSRSVIYRRIAVAASFVLLAGLAWILWMNQKGTRPTIHTDEPVVAGVQWQEKINTTGTAMQVTMEDGSLVILSPESRIRYQQPFTAGNKRIIQLEGRADFKVAKDASRPFTVYADAVATTALGTQFTVTSFRESNEITVALHEGKVVVRPTDSIQKKWTNDIYMAPGDEVVYNKNTMLASLRHTSAKEVLVKAGIPHAKGTRIQKPDWYEFNGASLPEVFDQLSAYYEVDIYYYPTDVKNKYFTVRIKRADSLEHILQDIALLNQLSIDRKNGVYIVKKQQ